MSFSPGPWEFKEWGSQILDARKGSAQSLIATVAINTFRDEGRNNARLITVAPEILTALQAALSVIKDYLEYEHNGDPWVEDARAMGEMDIDDFKRDGRLDAALALVAKATGGAA